MSHNRNNKFILGVAMVCFMFMAIAITGTVAAQETMSSSCDAGDTGPLPNVPAGTGFHCTRPDDYPAVAGTACRAGYTLGTDNVNQCERNEDNPAVYAASITVRVWVCDQPNSKLGTPDDPNTISEENPPLCEYQDYEATQADIDRATCPPGWEFAALVPAIEEERDQNDVVTTVAVAAVPASCDVLDNDEASADYDASVATMVIVDPPPEMIEEMEKPDTPDILMPADLPAGMPAAMVAFVWSSVQGNDLIGHAAAPVRLFSAAGGVQIFYASGNEGIYATTISRSGGTFSATNPVNDQPVSVTTSGGVIMLRTAYDDGKAYDININADNSVTIINW